MNERTVTCFNCRTKGHTVRTCRRHAPPLRILQLTTRLKSAGVIKADAQQFVAV